MAPKKAAKKPKTPKVPTYVTADEALQPFGLKVHDLCTTPLGVMVTVLGVKYTDQEAKAGARLWARYACGLEAPLDVQPDESAAAQGYTKCSNALHIERDLTELQAEVDAFELYRQAEAAAAAGAAAAAAAPPPKKGAAPKKKK